MNDIELLAPAGAFSTALAAFNAGADAVYLGLDAFSARAQAVNFSAEDLRRILAVARARDRKIYVTFNTVVDDADLDEAVDKLQLLDELRPDGIIVQDLGIARLVRKHFPALALHASTQLVAHNLESVLALKELGFTRVVLSRELSLAEIETIAKRSGVEIEVFVHGALCYSLSGLCLFSAIEKRRSGNRGQCAYCCRLPYTDAEGRKSLPFSMRDLRLDEDLIALKEAGVASLKIEGRMKSSLYVASVVKRYRDLLDGRPAAVTRADLETVFSRRTTTLRLHDGATTESVIDPTSLGHLGTPIGTVKRITKDREGRSWLRFHTSRPLERHDGLQFAAPEGGKSVGFGIGEMRLALARHNVFETQAGADVEILLPDPKEETRNGALAPDLLAAVKPGATIYCSASNAMKRRFPEPSFRPSDYPAGTPVDVEVALGEDALVATANGVEARVPYAPQTAKDPSKTEGAVRKAFERMGESDWSLGQLTVDDPAHRFAPASLLNDLRRELVGKLDDARADARRAKRAAVDAALAVDAPGAGNTILPPAVTRIRLGQPVPDHVPGELVVAIGHRTPEAKELPAGSRLALPVFTHEKDFNKLRTTVKRLVRAGFKKWEAADLATLRLLKQCGITDITADWTLYAFNREALTQLAELGIKRVVASPENARENVETLAGTRPDISVEMPTRMTVPLFLSLTKPAAEGHQLTGIDGSAIAVRELDGLWITSRPEPTFADAPGGVAERRDYSLDI